MFEEDRGFLLEIHRRNPYKWNFLNIKDSITSSSFFLKKEDKFMRKPSNNPSRAKSYSNSFQKFQMCIYFIFSLRIIHQSKQESL